jgi:hypothetical protein
VTVKELISKLQQHPEDAVVFIPDNEAGLDYSPVLQIALEPGHLHNSPFIGGDLKTFRPNVVGDNNVLVGPINFKALIIS